MSNIWNVLACDLRVWRVQGICSANMMDVFYLYWRQCNLLISSPVLRIFANFDVDNSDSLYGRRGTNGPMLGRVFTQLHVRTFSNYRVLPWFHCIFVYIACIGCNLDTKYSLSCFRWKDIVWGNFCVICFIIKYAREPTTNFVRGTPYAQLTRKVSGEFLWWEIQYSKQHYTFHGLVSCS